MTCKHNWQFTDGNTGALKCTRCGAVTGPKTYEERVQDILEYDTTQFYMPTGQLQVANFKPNYNLIFHRDGKEVGKFDFNGPEMIFEGDAAESAKVFVDWVANAFHGRLEEEREAGRQEALAQEPVAYLCENAAGHKYFRWKKPSSTYKPIALYTSPQPPQRTWVGLTDEELMQCLDQGYGINMRFDGFARIIEAKLKEKNT